MGVMTVIDGLVFDEFSDSLKVSAASAYKFYVYNLSVGRNVIKDLPAAGSFRKICLHKYPPLA